LAEERGSIGLDWVVAIGPDYPTQSEMAGIRASRRAEVRGVTQEVRSELREFHALGAHRERRLSKRALTSSVTETTRELDL